jgi:anti-sigma B factor antagonist
VRQRYSTAADEPTGWDDLGQVRCEPAESGLRVVLVGEVDLTMSAQWDRVFATLADAEPGNVTVDLSAATFIDSSVLGALVRLHRVVAEHDRAVTLTGVDGSVARTLSLSGVDRILSIVPRDET